MTGDTSEIESVKKEMMLYWHTDFNKFRDTGTAVYFSTWSRLPHEKVEELSQKYRSILFEVFSMYGADDASHISKDMYIDGIHTERQEEQASYFAREDEVFPLFQEYHQNEVCDE